MNKIVIILLLCTVLQIEICKGGQFSSLQACSMLNACVQNSVRRWQKCTQLVDTSDLPNCWEDLKDTITSSSLTNALKRKSSWMEDCMNGTKEFSVIDTKKCGTMSKRLSMMYAMWKQEPQPPQFYEHKKGQALAECQAWVMQTTNFCDALTPCCPQATYCELEYTLLDNSMKQASMMVLEHFKQQRMCLDKTIVTDDNEEKLGTMVSTQFLAK